VNLLEAFAQMTQDFPDIKLLLSGSNKGTLEYVKSCTDRLNLTEKVLFPGFVTDEAIASFYRYAIALVMPSFLGPTNMPLLEALWFDCPVICSNLAGHKEILGTAAFYFPPDNVDKMSDAMRLVLNRQISFNNSRDDTRELLRSKFSPENFIKCLESAFTDAMIIRKCWK
jgi:glycosyltransferase involved in cell wall biosynthesis